MSAPIFIDDREIEILAGRPVRKVSPKHRHAVVQGRLWAILSSLGRGRGTTGTEWRFRLDDLPGAQTRLVPDVAFLSYERWRPLVGEDRQEPPLAPDIAVEVRSPDDRLSNVMWKIRAYLKTGTLLVLDVLPEQRRIITYERDAMHEFGQDETFALESIPWLRFDVAEAFADLEPGE